MLSAEELRKHRKMLLQVTSSTGLGIVKRRIHSTSQIKEKPYKQEENWFAFLDHSIVLKQMVI